MTIGRQRIAWGTAWVWNPTDLFNPLNVLNFDYEELPAVDAVRAQYYRRNERHERWVFGGSWVGDIYSAGFRGEIIVSEEPNSMITTHLFEDFDEESLSSFDKPLVAITLSADYTFPNTFYIHTEMLYNNNGKTENTFLFFEEALSLGMLSPARWAIYQDFSYDITPLL